MTDKELWEEKWLDVDGFEKQYSISNLGRLYSIRAERILEGMDKHGYMYVIMGNGKTKKHIAIHRLVAQHFIPLDETRPHVNHLDGDTKNNNMNNLEWVTPRENQLHAYKTGLRKRMAGEKHFGAKITEEDVRFIRASQGNIKLKVLAEKYGIAWKYVWSIQHRKAWKHVV